MAENPQPDMILVHISDGSKLRHLFRKRLTPEDMHQLVLVGESGSFLRSLPETAVQKFKQDQGKRGMLQTPGTLTDVEIIELGDGRFGLKHFGWSQVIRKNRFRVGDEIECWCLYDPRESEGEELNILIQKV